MIVTHGWPGSIIEQMKIIDPLTNPTAHGGTASDAFHLVIPSLPGYGFSGKPTAPGWNPVSIAKAWATLMQRLGYTKYVAQGGDWGNAISEVMALQQPPGLLGIHTNMAATVPPDVSKALAMGGPPPAGLSPDEKHAWDQLDDFYKNGLGYALEMNNRPQTLYGIVDSPVGLAAWMIDHDIRSYQMIARAFDGKPEGLTRDDVLDNVTLYWLTNTAISSARLYWDTRHNLPAGGFFDVRGIKIPVAVSAFAEEIYQAPKSWAEKAYPKLIHYNKLDKGTHFAAWEQPELFVAEMRAASSRCGSSNVVVRMARLTRTFVEFGTRRDNCESSARDEEAIRKLSPEQYRVTQQSGTEPPGTGEYLDNHEPGIYVDIVSGEPLFASSTSSNRAAGGRVSPSLLNRPMSTN